MRTSRLALALALSLVAAGCGATMPLLTTSAGLAGCFPDPASGTLAADPVFGTTIDTRPVIWPAGYSARPAGEAIEVLDPVGNVVARTGDTVKVCLGTDGRYRATL